MIKTHWRTLEKFDSETHRYLKNGNYISRYYAEKNRVPHTKIIEARLGWRIMDKNEWELATSTHTINELRNN